MNDLDTICPQISAKLSSKNNLKSFEMCADWDVLVSLFCEKCGQEFDEGLSTLCKNVINYKEYFKIEYEICPYCSGRECKENVNDIKTLEPNLVLEWSENNKISPNKVARKSLQDYLWRCPKCHQEYSERPKFREIGDKSCPYCANRKVLFGMNDLLTLDPELAKELSPNNNIEADQIVRFESRVCLWVCPTCHGEYKYYVDEREIGDKSCPYCNEGKLLSGWNDLQTTHPLLAKEYSINNKLPANQVKKDMNKTCFWICPTCHGEYQYNVKERELGDKSCPYCSNKKILTGTNDLLTLDSKLAKELSPNNHIAADQIIRFGSGSYLWVCPTCHGEYQYNVKERKIGDKSCPYCTNKLLLPGYNSIDVIKPELMKEWLVEENILEGRYSDKTICTSTEMVWLKCKECNYKYKISLKERLLKEKRNQSPCPRCNGKRKIRFHFIKI